MKSAKTPPSRLIPIDELDQAIVDLSARINAATYELLLMIWEFEDRADGHQASRTREAQS